MGRALTEGTHPMSISMKFFLKMMTWAWETGFRAGKMAAQQGRKRVDEGDCKCGRNDDLF